MKRRAFFVLVLAFALVACTRGASDPSTRAVAPADKDLDDADLIGTTPPEWTTTEWVNAPPTTLAQLRGRVVLVRWFMGTSCPFCSATAPSLKKLHAEYADRGLTVIGLYHHKEEGPLQPGQYEGYVRSFGFTFPVARDPEWKTLHSWWLDKKERDWTSVSFLLDRQGRIRGIHPGGKYAPSDPAYASLRRGIEHLLTEAPLVRGDSKTRPLELPSFSLASLD